MSFVLRSLAALCLVLCASFLPASLRAASPDVVIVVNDRQRTIAGPLQIVLERLDHGVKLANAAGTRRGDPYLTFLGSLAPRKQATVEVRFEVQRHGHPDKHDRDRHDRDHDDDIDYQVRVFSGLFE